MKRRLAELRDVLFGTILLALVAYGFHLAFDDLGWFWRSGWAIGVGGYILGYLVGTSTRYAHADVDGATVTLDRTTGHVNTTPTGRRTRRWVA